MEDIDPNSVVLDKPKATSHSAEIDPSTVVLDSKHGEIDPDSVQLDSDQPDSLGGQIGAGVEGLTQGIGGPIATGIELATGKGLEMAGVPNSLNKKGMAEREAKYPVTHAATYGTGLVGGLFTGMSEAGLIAKGAQGVAKAAELGKFGSVVLKGAIEGGLFSGGEEANKIMLGKEDPEHPVASSMAHTGFGALIGSGVSAGLGAMSRPAATGLKDIANSKISSKAAQFMEDFGSRFKSLKEGVELPKGTSPGEKAADKLHKAINAKFFPASIGATKGAYEGYEKNGLPGAAVGAAKGYAEGYGLSLLGQHIVKPILGKVINEAAVPYALRVLQSGQTDGLIDSLAYADNVQKGARAMQYGVNSLFSDKNLSDMPAFYSKDKDKEKIKKSIEEDWLQKQIQNEAESNYQNEAEPFAEGGPVKKPVQIPQQTDHFSSLFPAQNIMMNTAKGRVYNYLHSLKPQQNPSMLPFDDDVENKESDRAYNKAIDIAASPLSIVHSIKDGSLTPEELKHFKTMWPEIHSQMSQGIIQKTAEAKLKKEKPPYKIRQAMSLFLGTPLDSTMTPMMMQAAQSVYAKKQSPQQSQGALNKPKKGTSTLSDVSKQYETRGQAAETRRRG